MNLASLGGRLPSEGDRIVKLRFRAILADEKGLHEACMSKGGKRYETVLVLYEHHRPTPPCGYCGRLGNACC